MRSAAPLGILSDGDPGDGTGSDVHPDGAPDQPIPVEPGDDDTGDGFDPDAEPTAVDEPDDTPVEDDDSPDFDDPDDAAGDAAAVV